MTPSENGVLELFDYFFLTGFFSALYCGFSSTVAQINVCAMA